MSSARTSSIRDSGARTSKLIRQPPPPMIAPQGDPPPPPTLRLILAGITLLAMVAVAQRVILPERRRNRELEARVQKLADENRELEQYNARLTSEVRALQDDPVYVEHILRRSMRYVKPSEVEAGKRKKAVAH